MISAQYLVAAFLSAMADAACDRSQSSFPLHVLPPTSALRRLLDPLSAPASPAASRVTLDALSGPSGSDSDDEVWLAPDPPSLPAFVSVRLSGCCGRCSYGPPCLSRLSGCCGRCSYGAWLVPRFLSNFFLSPEVAALVKDIYR